MANPAEAAARVVHGYVPEEEAIARPDRRVRLILADSAVLFTSAAVSVIIYAVLINPSASNAFVGFALFLVGVSLSLLAPVADQFPVAARIGVAVAMALRGYLFGGG